jgi:hypothetical protein
MAILELRLLPPIAVARLGSSPEPLDAFDVVESDDDPLGFRRIVPRPTFIVDAATGEIVTEYTPAQIRFKDDQRRIRPVAPLLEVFARTSDDERSLVPLTSNLLSTHGASIDQLSWSATVGNLKIFRRTGRPGDKILATAGPLRTHGRTPLLGRCDNFLKDKVLPLGFMQFIKPTETYPEIRLRFTPAAGKVYGSSRRRHVSADKEEDDPIIISDDLVVYDTGPGRGTWRGYTDPTAPTTTNPGEIYAGFDDADGNHVSWGYLDDECDGHVRVQLELRDGTTLSAHAHIGAGPPAFAPDTLPLRAVSDELEQMLYGVSVDTGEYTLEEAADLVRRGLESVRLVNTTVMNGNPVNGRLRVASTMVAQDANDFERMYAPIAAASLVDNLALRALHERVFSALLSGTAPWFPDLMRRPEEIGDLSDQARRKMPAMMRGADARALTFTRRQIDLIVKAATGALASAARQGRKDQP